MTAREDLFNLAAQDMPVAGYEVDEAIDAFARELTGKVRDLHRPVAYRGLTICAECSAYDGDDSCDNTPTMYDQCGTLRALNREETP